MNAASVCFQAEHRLLDGTTQTDYDELRVEELIVLGRRMERELVPYTPLKVEFDQPPVFMGLGPQAGLKNTWHPSIFHSLTVFPDGRTAPGGSTWIEQGVMLDNLHDLTLDETWMYHPILASLRADLPERLEGICGRCLLNSSCLGHRVTQTYQRTGSFLSPYWFCEEAEQAGLFPASRIKEYSVR